VAVDEEFRYRVRVLGPISVDGPDGPLDPGGGKPRLLLSLVVAAAGSVVSTERLIDGLWGDDPPATARKTVQVHLSNLRRSLGARFPLETTRTGYRIDPDRLSIDAVLFEAELVRAEALRESSPAETCNVLAAALQLWTGPPYADVADQEAIRPEVVRLTELRLQAVEQRIDADLRIGRHDAVLGELEALTRDHPFRERLRELQMVALYRSGRQADALRAYERTRLTLADELGLDPGPALRQLYQKILDQSAELDRDTSDTSNIADTSNSTGSTAIDGETELGPSTGRSIRGYELRQRLGDSAHGTVFRAYQASPGREVALRVIPPAAANQPAFVKRFEASCQLLAEFTHPHIVGLYDYWRDPGGAYLAMPLMRGGTLERSLERSVWRPPAALHLLDQIGSALGYAHRRGVTHGDVRASNVMLDEDGNGYLSDFVIGGGGMSPDQQAAQPIGPAADVCGLAVITCEMLTGTGPQHAVFTRVELPPGFGALIQRATDPNQDRRFEQVSDYLRSLRQCFGSDVVSTVPARAVPDTRNPFKGLRAFREIDSMDFFGRDDLLRELIERVSNNGVTAVVGPSGSGKSSLVKAGLLPDLRRRGLSAGRDLVIAEMFPGAYPFEELESALMRVAVDRPAGLLAELSADDRGLLRVVKRILPDDGTDLLLIIDQFEELFALTADESVRQAFLANLTTVASDERHRVRVVVTLRADFFDRPLSYPAFGELLRSSMTTVTLPGESSLAEAISEPARRVGLEIEPGLIPTILRDVADQPGALPLMQYALTELADHRNGNLLTIDTYRRTGGVVGALATRAEEIFSSLPAAGREAAREIFLRLVSVNDESDDTRRRVRRTELEGLGVDLRTLGSVIDAFGSFRLLSFDHDPITRGPTVEVAHEALIRAWPRCRQWVDERRDDLRSERRLESVVTEWVLGDHDPNFLISGVRLERYEQWIGSSPVRLTADEREFIEASHTHEQRRQKTATKRRRRLLAGVSTLAVIALAAAALAIVQRNRADDAARAAAQQTRTATEAAARADSLRGEAERSAALDQAQAAMARLSDQQDPDLRILLALAEHDALEAMGLSDPAVTSALYQSTFDDRVVARLPVEVDETPVDSTTVPTVSISASPDGSMFVMGLVHGLRVSAVDVSNGGLISPHEFPTNTVGSNWLDNGMVMTGRYDGIVEFWKPTGEQTPSVAVSSLPVLPLMFRNGQLIFAEFTTRSLERFRLVVQNPDTGERIFPSSALFQDAIVSPSGNYLAVFEDLAGMVVYDTRSWTDVTPAALQTSVDNSNRIDAAWSAKGDQLWVLTDDRVARFDVATGEQVATIDAELTGLDFVSESLDGQLVAIGGNRTPIRVFDTSSASMSAELPASPSLGLAHGGRSVTWGADRHLMVAQWDSTLIWDLAAPEAAEAFWTVNEIVPVVTSITPSGERILGSADGGVLIFDASGNLRSSLTAAGESNAPAVVSPDATTLAVPLDQTVKFVDIATGAVRAIGPSGLARPLALSNEGRLAVVGTARQPNDQQHRLAIVDGATGRQLFNLGGLIDGERAAFTSDARKVVIPVSNVPRTTAEPRRSALVVFDTVAGKQVGVGRSQECVTAVAISHDDAMVASLGCGGDIVLLDLAKLTFREPLRAVIGGAADDTTPAVGVVFGPGDEIVIVTRQDGRVEAYEADAGFRRLWSFDVGEDVGVPEVHDGMVWVGTTYDVGAGTPQGGMVAMPLDVDALVTLARPTATRSLTTDECRQFLEQPTC
jgi:DNA-binding SARP family transcriptional activator/WD40 repeat protein